MTPAKQIIVFSPVPSPRLEYVCRFVFSDLCGVRFRISGDPESLMASGFFRISYARDIHEGVFNLYAEGLLSESHIHPVDARLAEAGGQKIIFPAPPGFDMPFDILGASFFLLSRYEEYLPYVPDSEGRFRAENSLAYRNGFLGEPVIERWAVWLQQVMHRHDPSLVFGKRKFSFIPTIDVDNPWAYLHKGMLRNAGGLLKSLSGMTFREAAGRVEVLLGNRSDPYDNFDYIIENDNRHGCQSLIFFLTGNYGGRDSNYALRSPAFSQLVRRLASLRETGIHFSWRSHRDSDLFMHEKQLFQSLTGHEPLCSRQHYLMMRFPDTFRDIVRAGIRSEYSMGYASLTGFRAGTCTPFQFYDLVKDIATGLTLYPFQVMDVTLKHYMKLDPRSAIREIAKIIARIREVNGCFVSIWHNESLSGQGEWKGWREVYEAMFEEAVG